MRKLLIPILVIVCSVAAASWQQYSILAIRGDIERLTAELAKSRADLRHHKSDLADAERRLADARRHTLSKKEPRQSVLLSPETEGLWPSNQVYFYLRKDLLPMVRLEDIDMSPAEVRASGVESRPDEYHSIENRFLQNDRLNEHVVKLLGMTDDERLVAEKILNDLQAQVRDIEVAKIQRHNPPKLNKDSKPIIATIPSLAADIQSLIERASASAREVLGSERAGLLVQQAEIYFNRYGDGLGELERDFVYSDHNLWVTYRDRWGERCKSTTFYVPAQPPTWEYAHLFGPGAPAEIK